MDSTALRIVLWDIDGTIVRSATATTFTEYTRPVLATVFGTAGRIDEVPLTGMTDLQYIAESLSCEGITREVVFERIGEISARYFCEIERAASNGAEFHVLPGDFGFPIRIPDCGLEAGGAGGSIEPVKLAT